MALQMEVSLENGINIQYAYLKVSKVNFSYTDVSSVSVGISVFKDKDAYEAMKPEIINFFYTCTGTTFDMYFSEAFLSMSQVNHLTGVYEWLKSMPEFVTAEDI